MPDLEILHLDNHLLVINKPPGMLSQADRTGDPDALTLSKMYIRDRFQKPGKVYLGLVHRLDRPASGVMVFARTSKAASRLAQQFRDKTVEKRYMIIVEGILEGEGKYIDYLLKREGKVSTVSRNTPGAQQSQLSWKAVVHNNCLSLIEVNLETGRPHQIRVQFASRGNPVLGDLKYGAKGEFDGKNLALHCFYLRVQHPVKKNPVGWSSYPPESWQAFFRQFYAAVVTQFDAD